MVFNVIYHETLLKSNITPDKLPSQQILVLHHQFSGAMLNCGGVCCIHGHPYSFVHFALCCHPCDQHGLSTEGRDLESLCLANAFWPSLLALPLYRAQGSWDQRMSGARGKVETIGDQSKNNKYCIYIYIYLFIIRVLYDEN